MKKILIAVLLTISAGAATAQEAVLQLFSCNLNEGKTQANVWTTLEMLAGMAAEAPEQDPGFGIFLWLPHRGALGYDFIWGVTGTDLNSMAQGSTGYVESGNAAMMAPRFADLGSCNSSINFTRQLRSGVVGTTDDRMPDAFVETFSCAYRDGADSDDLDDAVEFWNKQMDDMASPAQSTYEAFLVTPFRGMRAGVEFGWIGTYPDLITFAQGSTEYLASKGGRAADERFDKMSRCQNATWTGYWVLTPQNVRDAQAGQ
jgi:hypothetical protein